MKKHAMILVALVAPMLICSAQKVDGGASALTATQAAQVAKILRQHNVMMEYCGCCEKPSVSCVKISKVSYDSVSVNVKGVNMETGAAYSKTIDVAEAWVPQLATGTISKMLSVGQLAKINCDPCTTPSVPTGELGRKVLTVEMDGLMEASGASGSTALKNGKNEMKPEIKLSQDEKKAIKAINGEKRSAPLFKEEGVKTLKRDINGPIRKLPKNTEN